MTENKSVDKRWENPQPLGINSLANSSSLRSDLYPARLFIPAGFGFSRSVINRIDIYLAIFYIIAKELLAKELLAKELFAKLQLCQIAAC